MPRKIREERPLVYVFSEGESEQAYVDFLKEHFEENVRIMRTKGTGLFDEAWDKFRKDKSTRTLWRLSTRYGSFLRIRTGGLIVSNRLFRITKMVIL